MEKVAEGLVSDIGIKIKKGGIGNSGWKTCE
jgi:hypothetical protein